MFVIIGEPGAKGEVGAQGPSGERGPHGVPGDRGHSGRVEIAHNLGNVKIFYSFRTSWFARIPWSSRTSGTYWTQRIYRTSWHER